MTQRDTKDTDYKVTEQKLAEMQELLERQPASATELHRYAEELREKLELAHMQLSQPSVQRVCRINRWGRLLWNVILLPALLLYLISRAFRALSRSRQRLRRVRFRLGEWLRLYKNTRRRQLEKKRPGITYPQGFEEAWALKEKFKALKSTLIPNPDGKMRMNVVVPCLDPDLVFGGYISLLHLVRRLVRAGHHVRFIVGEQSDLSHKKLLRDWSHRSELHDMFAKCEVLNLQRFYGGPVPVHSGDRFIAYSGWMAMWASQLAMQTPFKRFVFFIQEHEPIFHHNGSIRAALESSYLLPHLPVFNTQTLHDHFQREGLGIYDRSYSETDLPTPLIFEHAIADLTPPTAEQLDARPVRKLLFYARPEGHASRNLFALALMGLCEAVEHGYFPGRWEFHGIGTLAQKYTIDVGKGHKLKIIPRVPQEEYETYIQNFDVGISLMMAPHPSILPFEMLSAGMVVVTNEYKYRDAEYYERISRNIVPCLTTPMSIAEALRTAAHKAIDTPTRLANAKVVWNRSWDEAFSPEFIGRLVDELTV